MELVQIYYVGELIAAIAVIASLLFVGGQMRQNANALRVSATAASVANWQETVLELAGSEHVAPAMARVSQANDPGDVDAVDALRVSGLLIAAAKNTEFAFYRHQSNEITDGLWEAARNGFLTSFSSGMVKEVIWPRVKTQVSPEFASFIEKELISFPDTSFVGTPQSAINETT